MSENEMQNLNLENENISSEDENLELTVEKKPKGYYCEGAIQTFMIAFGVIFLLCQFVFQIILTPIQVVGISMQPTINMSVLSDDDEDHSDIVYYRANSSYKNGDIVIVSNESLDYISDPDVEFLIKRVIALPGQTITFFLTDVVDTDPNPTISYNHYYYDFVVKDENGNSVDIDDSFVKEEMFFTDSEYFSLQHFETYKAIFQNLYHYSNDENRAKSTITVSPNTYFVMGDNRNHSTDSRVFGSVKSNHICGEVKLQIPYGDSLLKAILNKIKSLI